MILNSMRRSWSLGRGAALVPLLALIIAAAGCGKDEKSPVAPLPAQTVVPDFSLTDVNPNSATSGQAVSPRQQLTRISAWYFGHAT
jgi:hypothetical protein